MKRPPYSLELKAKIPIATIKDGMTVDECCVKYEVHLVQISSQRKEGLSLKFSDVLTNRFYHQMESVGST